MEVFMTSPNTTHFGSTPKLTVTEEEEEEEEEAREAAVASSSESALDVTPWFAEPWVMA